MYEFEANNPVIITQFKWAGKWGPFHIKSHCQECDLVTSILRNIVDKDFKGKNVVLEVKPWLNDIFFALRRGAWHPPIILINGRKFFQYSHKKPLFDKEKLIQAVVSVIHEKQQVILTRKESSNRAEA
jgi:hypothetical protein